MPDITQYIQLGGQVVVVVLFLNYLTKRDNEWKELIKNNSSSNTKLAISNQRLIDTIVKNTGTGEKNISATYKNTGAVEELTGTVKETNGKK